MARRLIVLVLLLLGCVDALGSIDLGTRFSGQGLLTILYAIAAWGLVLGSGKISKAGLKTVWPFIALVVWALTTMFWYTPSVSGTQNVLCLASFIGLALLATGLAQTWELQGSIQMFFRYGIWCAAAAYGWCLLNSSLSTSEIIGPRSFGIAALFGVAWYASKWRFGKHGAFVLAAILLVEIGASLSRGALVASLVMLTLGRVSATVKGWLWGLLSLGVAMVAFWWMFNNIEPLRDHFLLGDVQWHVGDVGINVSGRSSLWRVTYDSFLDSPWGGKGAGPFPNRRAPAQRLPASPARLRNRRVQPVAAGLVQNPQAALETGQVQRKMGQAGRSAPIRDLPGRAGDLPGDGYRQPHDLHLRHGAARRPGGSGRRRGLG